MSKEYIIKYLYSIVCSIWVIGLLSLSAVMIGIRPFVIISESMSPEIPKNSLVLINTRYDIEDLKAGQNIAYILGKVEAIHKVTAIKNSSVT